MSISSALAASVSGLNAFSSSLAAISDNIANSQTVGYKRTRTDFSALVTLNSREGRFSAGGVDAAVVSQLREQGELQRTNSATDLAISGDGFFVVSPQAGTGTTATEFLFTRAGQFSVDDEGFLQNGSGLYLHGWPVEDDGSVNINASNLALLEPINVQNVGGAAQASTEVIIDGNLRANQPISSQLATYDPTASANNLASGNVTADFQRSVQVYDSLGASRTLTFSFLKDSTPNEWLVEAHIAPASDVVNSGALVDGQVATGRIVFTPSGEIDFTNTTLPTSITIGASDGSTGGDVSWGAGLGVSAQTLSLDLGSSERSGGFTQFEADSTLLSSTVNGSPFGQLSAVEVDDGGFVTAFFENGLSRQIYQLPLATFPNENGLRPLAGGAFGVSIDSGAFTLRQASVGAGSIEGSALESSTVDIAKEFTDLIVTQRAYSANTRVISTADQMLEELIRLRV